MPRLLLSLLAALTVTASAQGPRFEMRSFVNIGGTMRPAFAWCDAPGAVVALGPWSGAAGAAAPLVSWTKTRAGLGAPFRVDAVVGEADTGAGQVHYPLRWRNGAAWVPGDLHLSNVENVLDPAYRMTRVNAFTLSDVAHPCRYVPQAAFLGVTGKRTVIVWESGGQATYATRNFDGTPGVLVRGGVSPADLRLRSPQGFTGLYTWQAPGGVTYHLNLRRNELTAQRGDRLLLREHFLAYSISNPVPPNVTPTKEQP
ncbi:hypothetical protein [Deinococcus multiflagellatus]|uniref:Uncharacterized protein n=1 Tax=Deinococcus multiflagellatus TaxID=1656887 RepID=A0ABW1ZSP7_9DEIO|nr:hypothetical protein [Deinococcus multiflagellatus]MBZ9716048.1 hypothetical protein [Deinococcus multiflagellatus]